MPRPPAPPGDRPPRRRRLDPDQYPFNQLPTIVFEPDTVATQQRENARDPGAWENWDFTPIGTIHLTRGDFNSSDITTAQLRQLAEHPGTTHVVFTNRLGQHHIRRRGDLLPVGIDPSRGGYLITARTVSRAGADDLAQYAERVREHADHLVQEAAVLRAKADQYAAMAADGWEISDYEPETWHWPLRDTKPGPSYAPRPRR